MADAVVDVAEAGGFGDYVSQDLVTALRGLGVIAPNSIQANAIPLALSGRDVMVVAQTGSGKTLVFLLPLLQRVLEISTAEQSPDRGDAAPCAPETLVLAPTTELAHQIYEVACHLCSGSEQLASAVAFSALGSDEGCQKRRLARLVVGTPDSLLTDLDDGSMSLERVRMVAVDEADSVLLESGHSSCQAQADEILRRLEQRPEAPQVLLTMAHLRSDREKGLLGRFPAAQQVRHSGVLVPTLRQAHHYFRGDRGKKLLFVLKEAMEDEFLSEGTTLVFCSTSQDTEDVCKLLADSMPALAARPLHGGTAAADRLETLRAFRAGEVRLLATTDAAARGLDLPSLRHVIMWDVPPDTTAWVHIAGRTARRGQQGLVTCLVHADQQRKYQWDFQNHHALQPAEKLQFKSEVQ